MKGYNYYNKHDYKAKMDSFKYNDKNKNKNEYYNETSSSDSRKNKRTRIDNFSSETYSSYSSNNSRYSRKSVESLTDRNIKIPLLKVINLSPKIKKEHLIEIFNHFGTVIKVYINEANGGNNTKLSAFIEFKLNFSLKKSKLSEDEDIVIAHESMNKAEIDESIIETEIVYLNNKELNDFFSKKNEISDILMNNIIKTDNNFEDKKSKMNKERYDKKDRNQRNKIYKEVTRNEFIDNYNNKDLIIDNKINKHDKYNAKYNRNYNDISKKNYKENYSYNEINENKNNNYKKSYNSKSRSSSERINSRSLSRSRSRSRKRNRNSKNRSISNSEKYNQSDNYYNNRNNVSKYNNCKNRKRSYSNEYKNYDSMKYKSSKNKNEMLIENSAYFNDKRDKRLDKNKEIRQITNNGNSIYSNSDYKNYNKYEIQSNDIGSSNKNKYKNKYCEKNEKSFYSHSKYENDNLFAAKTFKDYNYNN